MNSNISQHQINLDTLARLQNQPGEIFEQLISTYNYAVRLINCRHASTARTAQYAELQHHAHSIKSSSLQISASTCQI